MALTRTPLLAPKELPPAEREAYFDGLAAASRSVDSALRLLKGGFVPEATRMLTDLLRTMEEAAK